MDANSIINSLTEKFPNEILEPSVESDIRISSYVDKDAIVNVCKHLLETLEFDHLSCECGVDYPDRNEIEVVYHIASYSHPVVLTLKAKLDRDAPQIESIVSLYWNANWYERETYELYGVKYTNHPDLKVLLLPEDMLGEWPLRKDYEGFPNKTAKNLV